MARFFDRYDGGDIEEGLISFFSSMIVDLCEDDCRLKEDNDGTELDRLRGLRRRDFEDMVTGKNFGFLPFVSEIQRLLIAVDRTTNTQCTGLFILSNSFDQRANQKHY